MRLAPNPDEVAIQPILNPELCDRYEPEEDAGPFSANERGSATAWLNTNIDVYVLNLADDTQRWHVIAARLSALGIKFQRFPAVNITAPGAYSAAKEAGVVPRDFRFEQAQRAARTEFQGMHGIAGTVGCAASHLAVMKRAASAGHAAKALALVLEDDVRLADDFAARLRRLLEAEAPCDWEAISLRSKCPYGACVSPHLTRVLPDGNEPAARCRHGVNYGFFAMLYRRDSLKGLKRRLDRVVWNEDLPHCLDIDVALASISDVVGYYAVPSVQRLGLLTEGSMGSSRTRLNQLGSSDAKGFAANTPRATSAFLQNLEGRSPGVG